MQDLRAQMAAAEGRSAGSTSLTTSPGTPTLTIVALALAAVSCFVLLYYTLHLSLFNQSFKHVSNSLVLFSAVAFSNCGYSICPSYHYIHCIWSMVGSGHMQALQPFADTSWHINLGGFVCLADVSTGMCHSAPNPHVGRGVQWDGIVFCGSGTLTEPPLLHT